MFLEFVAVRWSVKRLSADCGAGNDADDQGMLQAQQQVRDSFGRRQMLPVGGGCDSHTASVCTRILHLLQCVISYARNLTSAILGPSSYPSFPLISFFKSWRGRSLRSPPPPAPSPMHSQPRNPLKRLPVRSAAAAARLRIWSRKMRLWLQVCFQHHSKALRCLTANPSV
jgi:hypothetical protein